MSVAATNWVWLLNLKPVQKIILLALADVSDEKGYCWPSLEYLAKKTNMDKRSIQRTIKLLQKMEIINIKTRFIKDKIQTSNGYYLNLSTGGDKLSPPTAMICHQGVAGLSPGDGIAVTQTNKKLSRLNQQQQLKKPSMHFIESNTNPYSLPNTFTGSSKLLAEQLLNCIDVKSAAQIVSTLNKYMANNTVRQPIAYLKGLINKLQNNEYEFECQDGIKIAKECFKKEITKSYKTSDTTKLKNDIKKMYASLDMRKN